MEWKRLGSHSRGFPSTAVSYCRSTGVRGDDNSFGTGTHERIRQCHLEILKFPDVFDMSCPLRDFACKHKPGTAAEGYVGGQS